MAINFNFKIEKKDLWLLAAIFVFLAGVGYVIAYNSAMSGGNPAVMGHSSDEVMVRNSSGSLVSLQTYINQSGVGGGSLAFGTRVSKDTLNNNLATNNIYKAQTDGYLLVTQAGGPSVVVTVGKSNPPSDIVGVHSWSSSTTYGSISVPVPANEYAQVTGNIAGNPDIWWQPIGTGGLVKQ